jgi:hypothetical protein
MWKISAIADGETLEKNRSALKFTEFDVRFLQKEEFEKSEFKEDIALILFPWDGYREIFNYPQFKHYIEQRSVVVVGPTIYFFEVEDWVIDGSVCFLSTPVNSMQIESVLNEIRRVHGHGLGLVRDDQILKNSA